MKRDAAIDGDFCAAVSLEAGASMEGSHAPLRSPHPSTRAAVCGWLVLAAALATVSPSQAQSTALPPSANAHGSLTMEASVTSTGGASNAKSGLHTSAGAVTGDFTTQDFSQKQDQNEALGLAVEVRNLGGAADSATVDWYFFARSVKKGEGQYIFDHGTKPVQLTAGGGAQIPVQSASLHNTIEKKLHLSNDPNSNPSASVHKSGAVVTGWIVRLVADGKPLIVKASAPSLEELGRDDEMLAAYPRKAGKK
jgi:hypothetical protein